MANKALVSVADTIYELQKHLFETIQTDTQLHAAGSLMSKNDFKNVITERSIAKSCGYPLCPNPLSSNHVKPKGKYHISLREHRVYDLEEMRMYCSTKCLVESQAFLGTLQEERSTVLDESKIEEILGLFGDVGSGGVGKGGDGVGELRVKENVEVKHGNVIVGDANAIEGYVPRSSRVVDGKNRKQGSVFNDFLVALGLIVLFLCKFVTCEICSFVLSCGCEIFSFVLSRGCEIFSFRRFVLSFASYNVVNGRG